MICTKLSYKLKYPFKLSHIASTSIFAEPDRHLDSGSLIFLIQSKTLSL